VQGSVGDGHATDKHRRQSRHRGDGTGTPDLKLHLPQFGDLLLGRELVGHGPAWRSGHKAQPRLFVQGIHLEYHAIDLVGQGIAPGQQVIMVGLAAMDAGDFDDRIADRQPTLLEKHQSLMVGDRQVATLGNPDAIGIEGQRALGRDPRV